MNAPQKIAGFALGLAVVFAAAFGVGATVGGAGGTAAEPQPHQAQPTEVQDAPAADLPAGLSSTEDGYTLDLVESRARAGKQIPLRFRITDAGGAPVTRYVESHEKQLHLIVVRRDMAGFQHVHPTLADSGTWSVPVDLAAGDYRVFADFVPAGGEGLTLGADLHVAGGYQPQPLPPAATTATVDGYTVTLSGAGKAGESSPLVLSISRDGKPVTDLQPYLGAYGHLVALRASDLAYLHVHPMGVPGDGATPAGPQIGFDTTFPSYGDYRLFLDFKHGNVVRTAEFTVSIRPGQEPAVTIPTPEPAHGHGH